MSGSDAEQVVITAARMQLTWHYARLLEPVETERDAIWARSTVTETPKETERAGQRISELEAVVVELHARMQHDSVYLPDVKEAVQVLRQERRQLIAAIEAGCTREGSERPLAGMVAPPPARA